MASNTPQETVFEAITNERIYQDRKWGNINERPHEVGAWLTIMRELLKDADRAWMGIRGDKAALDEIRKVVSVGVATMEQHGIVWRKAVDYAELSCNFTASKADCSEIPNAKIYRKEGESFGDACNRLSDELKDDNT